MNCCVMLLSMALGQYEEGSEKTAAQVCPVYYNQAKGT